MKPLSFPVVAIALLSASLVTGACRSSTQSTHPDAATSGGQTGSGGSSGAGGTQTGGVGSGGSSGTGGKQTGGASGGSSGTGGGQGTGGVSGGASGTGGGSGGTSGAGGAGAGGSGSGGSSDAGVDTSADPRLPGFKTRLDALAQRTRDWWLAHGPDPVNGGFYGTLDRYGTPTGSTDKGIIQQARHLWTFSTWYERRRTTDPNVDAAKAAADSTYKFLTTSKLIDPNDKKVVQKVTRDGTSITDWRKTFYAQAFAIYALSTYGRIFGVSDAITTANQLFSVLDTYHDATNGGYDQSSDQWYVAAGKDMNTQIHIMEALTSLCEATGSSTVKSRVSEMVDVTISKMMRPQGYLGQDFTVNFSIQPSNDLTVSYGHDLETSFLVLEAARVAGRASEQAVLDGAKKLVVNAGTWGYDSSESGRGSYWDNGPYGGSPNVIAAGKTWWVQFEALTGLLDGWVLTHDSAWLDRFDKVLSWIEWAEDKTGGGEWFYSTTSTGTDGDTTHPKGEEWKASYHTLRSLMFNADRLAAM